MSSYITSIAVAAGVVVLMQSLLSFATLGTQKSAQEAVAELDPGGLLAEAVDPDSELQLDAILELGETPGELSETVPRLAELTTDAQEFVRLAAGIALHEIGAPGAPFLKPLFDSEDDHQLVQASTAANEIGPAAKIYFPQLTKMLKSDNVAHRKMALFALQGIGSESVELIDLVLPALDDKDFNAQCMACRALEPMGPAAAPAQEKLLILLKEGNPSVRGWAALVLGAIGPTENVDVVHLLGQNLDAFLQIEKQRSLLGISHLGSQAAALEDTIRTLMIDESKHVGPHAAYALWRVTGNAQESLDALSELMDDPSYRDDSIELVGKMGAAAAPLTEKLASFLENPETGTREIAVVALGNIGAEADPIIERIQKLLDDEDALLRYAARKTIEQIEAEKP